MEPNLESLGERGGGATQGNIIYYMYINYYDVGVEVD